MNTIVPLDMPSAATFLSTLIMLGVLLLTIILIFWPRSDDSAIKLLGSLMVLALAFGANDEAVYALAIFIVATLVTELDFLEKLAAIFWNREKYWEYRLKKASTAEVAAKQEAEAQEEIAAREPTREPGEPQPEGTKSRTQVDTAQAVQMAMGFEGAALDALAAGKGPFAPARINSRLKVVPSHGRPWIYDAIAETPGIHYVIEVKYGKLPYTLINAMKQLQLSIPTYKNYLLERGITAQVIPVAIVPSEINAPDLFHDWLPVLKFDSVSHRFTNELGFRKTVDRLTGHIA
ncbi:MAG: hypothetical protein HGB26_06960 [Desulfobulbaceae bacterium]|nr:hypothetical protein [Desulfobulbaceae bacterium]